MQWVGLSNPAGPSRLGIEPHICADGNRESIPTISTADEVASRNDDRQGTMQSRFSFDYY